MNDDLPPDVRRDLHSDAVRLNRQQLWFALLGLVLVGLAVPTAYLLRPYWFVKTLIASGGMLAGAARIFMEWRRLRQVDPSQYDE